jgi:hypothetical protein
MVQPVLPETLDVAAGILLADVSSYDRESAVAGARAELGRILGSSAVWVPGRLPPDGPGRASYLGDLPRFRAAVDVSPAERSAIAEAWTAALAEHVPGERQYLRVRVETPDDARRLRQLGSVDGLELVPSLNSSSHGGFTWRWPFRVGVLPGPAAEEWLAAIRAESHHGYVYDAELYAAGPYEILVIDGGGLDRLTDEARAGLDASPCAIVAGDAAPEDQLRDLGMQAAPAIAAAFAGHPSRWWNALFHEMSHDAPLDVAVEQAIRDTGVDALLSGPLRGLDITAPQCWFAAAAPQYPELAPYVDQLDTLDWTHEGGGATATSMQVREARTHGQDPTVRVPMSGPLAEAVAPPEEAGPLEEAEPPQDADEAEEAVPREVTEATEEAGPRRLVVRVRQGETTVTTVLPPRKKVKLLVRVAIPQEGDTPADQPVPQLPEAAGPTVQLDVVVSGDVWARQPAPRPIVISREKTDQPSTWAEFEFTTPKDGSVVTIDVTLLFRGKPLQAATFVSPVRKAAVDPDERPTLTVHNLSGPDEPTDDMRPVAVSLDGTGVELTRMFGGRADKVPITEVQKILDTIEEQVSRVTADQTAPETLDAPGNLELLVKLARIGVQLRRLLEPLDLDDAPSINVTVHDSTPVLPLELAYAGPAPDRTRARLCTHVEKPPPPGQGCDKATARVVCPYAFWGLHRSISRTIRWDGPPKPPEVPPAGDGFEVLYASTSIADTGARAPLPGDQVLTAARKAFATVTRVKTWGSWRKAVESRKPRLLVILGHTVVVGTDTNLFIGKNSSISGVDITGPDLWVPPGPRPLVLLIACSSLAIGNAFGTLPGVLTSEGAGAVVGTLATITGPAGATAAVHLLQAYDEAARTQGTVGDLVAAARRSLLAEKRLMGLILVSHGEVDTKVEP